VAAVQVLHELVSTGAAVLPVSAQGLKRGMEGRCVQVPALFAGRSDPGANTTSKHHKHLRCKVTAFQADDRGSIPLTRSMT